MLVNLFFSSLPLLFSSFKGLLFSLQYINKLSKGFPVGDIMDHNMSCAYLLICSKSFVYNMSCIVRIITNQNVVKNRTGFDLYIMVVVSSDRIYVIWIFDTTKDCDGVHVFDQLWCLVPARLQSPHTAKVSEHIGLGHPQTLQKIDWAWKMQYSYYQEKYIKLLCDKQ